MKDLKLQDVTARVLGWHNRHPLARRVTAAQVQSVGYVVLPYRGLEVGVGAGPAPALAGAAPASNLGAVAADAHDGSIDSAVTSSAPSPTQSRSALTPAFTEDFIAPLAPAVVGRWAADHGMALTAARDDAPVRQVAASGGLDITRLQPVWVLTAQLQVGRARTRVLVGAQGEGQPAAVLGRRIWSPVRIGVLAVLPLLLLAGLAAFWWWQQSGAPTPVPVLARVPVPVPVPVPMPVPVPVPMPVPAERSASAAEAARPVDVEPTLGRVALPPIGPRADENRRAAQEARQSALPGSAAAGSTSTPPITATSPQAPALPAPTPAPIPPTVSAGPAFAVSTRLLRTRSEAEQVAAAMRALLVTPAAPQVRVEVLPVADDWRVVGWPYAGRGLADKARALLATRGMKVQVIDF